MRIIVPALFVAAFGFIVWLLVLYPAFGVRTRTTRTSAEMIQIQLDIQLWYSSGHGSLAATELNGITLNRKIADTFKHCRDGDIKSGSLVASDGLFRDAWGEPLLFCRTNDPICERLSPDLKSEGPGPFIIWSAGVNRSNEYGFGDDVVCRY